MGCTWGAHRVRGVAQGVHRVAQGVAWGAHGVSQGVPWDAHGVTQGCARWHRGCTGCTWGGTGGAVSCTPSGRALLPRWSRVPRSGEVTVARPKERDLLAGVKPLAQDLKLSKADQPRTTGAAVGLGTGPWGCPTPCPPSR